MVPTMYRAVLCTQRFAASNGILIRGIQQQPQPTKEGVTYATHGERRLARRFEGRQRHDIEPKRRVEGHAVFIFDEI
jgi:hypothetical protein